MGKVTIKDVAESAQVSTATVSRIINNKGYVDPDTERRVRDVMEALSYSPKIYAQQLASQHSQSGIIGAVFASRKHNFYQDELFYTIIQGIGDIVDENKYNLLVSHVSKNKEDDFAGLPSLVLNKMVDGLVIGGIPLEPGFIKRLIKLEIPVVLIGNYTNLNVSKVIVDNLNGGYQAVEHLIKLGHKRIGLISGDINLYPFRDKLQGYERAFKDYDIAIDENLKSIADYYPSPEEAGYFAAKKLFEQRKDVTALFIADSYMRIGVMAYLDEVQLRVPEDISIVTYATSQQVKFEARKFTCISIDEINIGHVAANHLFNTISGRIKRPMNITLSTSLLEGMSSKSI